MGRPTTTNSLAIVIGALRPGYSRGSRVLIGRWRQELSRTYGNMCNVRLGRLSQKRRSRLRNVNPCSFLYFLVRHLENGADRIHVED